MAVAFIVFSKDDDEEEDGMFASIYQG